MKILATFDTADFSDCVNTGYTFCLYDDGHLSAEYCTSYQGGRNGVRFVTGPGHVDVSKIVEDDIDRDAEAMLTSAVQGVDPSHEAGWRQTRRGHVIR